MRLLARRGERQAAPHQEYARQPSGPRSQAAPPRPTPTAATTAAHRRPQEPSVSLLARIAFDSPPTTVARP